MVLVFLSDTLSTVGCVVGTDLPIAMASDQQSFDNPAVIFRNENEKRLAVWNEIYSAVELHENVWNDVKNKWKLEGAGIVFIKNTIDWVTNKRTASIGWYIL